MSKVVSKLEEAIRVAMEEKNKTLRPEIQLLNKLLKEKDRQERKRLLNRKASGDALAMNGGYFFSLLEKFTSDVEAQQQKMMSSSSSQLLTQLREIKEDAIARRPPSNGDLPSSEGKGFG